MADAKAELIRLAGQMVLCQSMPEIDAWDWPRRATQRLWRQAGQAEERAQEQCRRWAMAIKEIADALPEQQPAQGEAVAYWGAVDSDGTLHMTLSADDANGGSLARQEINDWINEAIAEDGIATRLVALYTAPPASIVPPPMPMPETSTGDIAEDMRLIGKVMGWNLCRAAMFSIVGK